MMAKNVTITVPDDLKADLEHFRKRLEISAICATALRREVESLRAADQQTDALKDTASRLRAQRRVLLLSRGESPFRKGFREGSEWAMNTATYEQITKRVADDQRFMLAEAALNSADSVASIANAIGQVFGEPDRDPEATYQKGYAAGVKDVWEKIRDSVER